MKRFFLLTLLSGILLLVVACSGLPRVYPAGDTAQPQIRKACEAVFPRGKWQLLHSIETSLPGGHKGFVMGLTVISSVDETVRCVIMTIEGLVLFDAAYDGRVTVKRAVAPFDAENFARGLVRDIRLIFFKPGVVPDETGRLKNGSATCRYRDSDGHIVDVITRVDGNWEIRQYDQQLRVIRTVKGLRPGDFPGISKRIELTAAGLSRYVLVMDLVEAVPLDP